MFFLELCWWLVGSQPHHHSPILVFFYGNKFFLSQWEFSWGIFMNAHWRLSGANNQLFWHYKIYLNGLFNQIIHNVFFFSEFRTELSALINGSLEELIDLSLNHWMFPICQFMLRELVWNSDQPGHFKAVSRVLLSNTVGISHMWLLNTWILVSLNGDGL